jgi:hypothetical protein
VIDQNLKQRFAMERETIGKRLAAVFAEERRKLLALHVLLGLALSPIPTLLTGWAYLLVLAPTLMLPSALYVEPLIWFWLTVYSILPFPAFLAWSLPRMRRVGFPRQKFDRLALFTMRVEIVGRTRSRLLDERDLGGKVAWRRILTAR